MIRLLEIACTSLLIVLSAPLMIFTWLWLVVNRVDPVIVNVDNPLTKPRFLTFFNTSGDDSVSKWVHRFSIDLLPCLFNVLGGSAGLRDIHRSCVRVGDLRHEPHPQLSRSGQIRLAAVLVIAFVVMLLAFLNAG